MKTTSPRRPFALARALIVACTATLAHAQAPLPAPAAGSAAAAAPAAIPPAAIPPAAGAPAVAPATAASAEPGAATPVDTSSLASLAWLEGCWRGSVNQREFREHWLPLRGGMMIGASQNVLQGKTLDYEYLRLESRADGIHYVALPSDKSPADFRLATAVSDDRGTHFAFVNVADAFPQQLVYHRGGEGWLYASIEGKLNGEARTTTFPMRRVDCQSGELIRK
ncbi:MAG: DUF6265 family protein [Casimicrobiaceae bacterium]